MDTYDYIVIGAGAAGCVLANRLSAAPDTTVLLLEAGGSDDSYARTRFVDLESLFSLWEPETDWGYGTEPSDGLDGRAFPITQGKVLGGGSSTNGRIFIRGDRRCFDGWAADGNDGWAYADVLPYFKKFEDYTGGGSAERGAGGPVPIMDLPSPSPVAQTFVDSAKSLGFNGPVDVNSVPQDKVVGYCQSTTTPELTRASTAACYVHPALSRPNLAVLTGALVSRVLFEGTTAVGAEFTVDGRVSRARAAREVIVSAGAFNTPKLLMLSGIGPAEHLRACDIDVVADLPGVGENLQDHLLVRLCHWLESPQPPLILLSEVNLFAHTRPGSADAPPDLSILFAPFLFPEYGPLDAGTTLVSSVAQPESRGRVRLGSPDPLVPPVITPNFLASDVDAETLVAGLELGRSLLAPLDGLLGKEIVPGPAVRSRADLLDYVRATAFTEWHPSCTARMGVDELAVVDPSLRVRGVERLRVVDSSIMPTMVNSNLHATVIMIGEKGADLILA